MKAVEPSYSRQIIDDCVLRPSSLMLASVWKDIADDSEGERAPSRVSSPI